MPIIQNRILLMFLELNCEKINCIKLWKYMLAFLFYYFSCKKHYQKVTSFCYKLQLNSKYLKWRNINNFPLFH